MLDSDTKRRIDTARDILVGKVPDPKSQVEQITIALIYKFMDDMDAESEELGGKRKFFAGEYARYGWPKLVRSGLGGHEVLNLYAEAITRMPENPGIPPLFRDIFKNAYLPYRDPETLRAFLKIIDEFEYDHSERLGDAFEYLLSVLGSQGHAGQFRTPRHIIDFIVAVIDPNKDETVLDPACGTAGFLISAYKHILRANMDGQDEQDKNKPDTPGNPAYSGELSTATSALTPDEKGRLATNFKGYDISPDMVRLSLVNLYLHGFVAPQIHEYDTLTSEDRWNDYADVILANPPFMSPKGGIRPHNRFSVKSKRSEVLFVDYMAEHLTPNGRAGIIVPEGIIFQSQNAYKQLRKMLVEEYLVAVVSLPAGVFNPYSGVKTSILILDKALAKKKDRIAFFKVENDGFDLGAQRGEIKENDLPQIEQAVREYMNMDGQDIENEYCPSCASMLNKLSDQGSVLIVAKEKIATNGEYNLSGERYRTGQVGSSHYEMIPFDKICTLEYGASLPKKKRVDGPYPVMGSNGISGYHNEHLIKGPAIIVGRKGSAGEVTYINSDCFPIDTTYYVKIVGTNRTDILYLYHLLKTLDLPNLRGGAGIPGLNRKEVYEKYKLPLPPLETQRQIVGEIEGYQKIIDGAQAVVDNYRPHIAIDPDWPMVRLGDVCNFKRGPFGGSLKKEIFVTEGYVVYEQSHAISQNFSKFRYFIDEKKFREMSGFSVYPRDIIMSCSGTMGRTAIVPEDAPPGIINQALLKLSVTDSILTSFLKLWMDSVNFQQSIENVAFGAAIRNVASVKILKELVIPLPPLETQQALVVDIDAEQALIAANREIIKCFEQKIQSTINRVWEDKSNRNTDPNRDFLQS